MLMVLSEVLIDPGCDRARLTPQLVPPLEEALWMLPVRAKPPDLLCQAVEPPGQASRAWNMTGRRAPFVKHGTSH